MGMDLFGSNPKDKTGEYFRASVWWWRPLADYTLDVAPEVANNCEHWHTNDGDGLDEENSIKLAESLQSEISSGKTAMFEKDYKEKLAQLPEGDFSRSYPFKTEFVQHFVDFLRSCGGFKIY